jgi:methylmalonyl-CoA mutase cobalamin-binding subunit
LLTGKDFLELHPIRVVARRTGLTLDVLRAWERRYRAVVPTRRGNRRFYSDEDVERLLLLRRLTVGGRSIGQVAGLETGKLRALLDRDEAAAARAPAATGPGMPGGAGDSAFGAAYQGRPDMREPGLARGTPSVFLDACLAAALAMDAGRLERELGRATLALPQTAVVEGVVAPLMRRIGDMWRGGELRIAQEHVVSAVLRTFLGGLARRQGAPAGDARLVVATPPGQAHELGALVTTAVAASEGWSVTYLGPGLPAEEIAAAAAATGARLVALSLVYPADDAGVADEILRLAELLPEEVSLVVGGAAATGYRAALQRAKAMEMQSMAGFRTLLEGLRQQPAR